MCLVRSVSSISINCLKHWTYLFLAFFNEQAEKMNGYKLI